MELHCHWEGNVKQNTTLDHADVVETCYRGMGGSPRRKTVFLGAKRHRFHVLFVLVSGMHPPLNLISYSVRTNRMVLSEQRWCAK